MDGPDARARTMAELSAGTAVGTMPCPGRRLNSELPSYASFWEDAIYKSTNGGATWARCGSPVGSPAPSD
ncbi:MAG: hypothetical protein JWN32_2499 [Solirubrobacterales bacterium]|nr:hypothetical protein [Solirubrobacterales bacterium]